MVVHTDDALLSVPFGTETIDESLKSTLHCRLINIFGNFIYVISYFQKFYFISNSVKVAVIGDVRDDENEPPPHLFFFGSCI